MRTQGGVLYLELVACLVTSEEYQLLLRLNQMTIAKYSDMTSLAGRLNQVSEKLSEKCKHHKHALSDTLPQAKVHTPCTPYLIPPPSSPVTAAIL